MSSNDAPSSSAGASSSKPLVPFFKKSGRARPASTRKRSASPSGSDTAEAAAQQEELIPSSVIRPQAKSSLAQPIVQGTKRSRAPDPAKEATRKLLAENDWKASESSLEESEERRRGFVTRSKDWDLEEGQEVDGEEAEARLGKRSRTDDAAPTIDGMYHGSAGYNTYIRPKEVTNSKIRAGPIKATSNIRAVTVTDYQPDVCKDYKETGFCGYGDSCKFLHDRGDYLAGWQLDKLAVNPTTGQTVEEEDSDDEDVPFACLICRQPFTEPIVTKCGHYFCMNCAIKRFAKTPKCYACGAPTGGMFNKAEKILAKLNKAQADKAERRKRDAFGELKSDDEDGGEGGGIEFGGGSDDDDE